MIKRLLIFLTAVFVATSTIGAPRGSSEYVYLKPTDTLYVEISDYVGIDGPQMERFEQIRTLLTGIFEERNYPFSYKIDRFSANRIPPDQPRLLIVVNHWGGNRMHEVEVRFSAHMSRHKDRNRIGHFAKSEALGFSSGMNERNYNAVMREALREVARELEVRLAEGIEMDAQLKREAEEDEAAYRAQLAAEEAERVAARAATRAEIKAAAEAAAGGEDASAAGEQ